MIEEESIDIFGLPNPGKYLVFVVELFLFLSLITVTGLGIYSFLAYKELFSNIALIGNNGEFILFSLKLYSLNTIFFPLTSIIYVLIIAIARPLYIRARYKPANVDNEMTDRIQKLFIRAGVDRDVKIQFSNQKVATQIINFWRPLILISKSKLFGYSDKEIDAIILHEIAHYKNKDLVAVELNKSIALMLVWQLLVSLILLTFIGGSLTLAVLSNLKLLVWNTSTQYIGELLLKTLGVNIIVPFIILVYILALVFVHNAVSAYRERRADARVKYLDPDAYHILVRLIARGTKIPNLFEKILQLGSERWTRHESLIDPRRLLRPNIGFVILFGVLWVVIRNFSYITLGYLQDIAGSSVRIIYLLRIIYLIVGALQHLIFSVWLLTGLVSSQVGKKNNRLKHILSLTYWYVVMNIVFGISGLPFDILFGFSPLTILYLNLQWILTVIDPSVIFTIIVVTLTQSIILDLYLVTPKLKKNLSLWLVYIPLLNSAVFYLMGIFQSYTLNRSVYKNMATFLWAHLATPDIQIISLSQFVQLFNGVKWIPPLGNRLLSVVFFFAYFILLVILGAGFDKCCCCGTDVKDSFSFSVSYKCKVCGYPLGMWLAGNEQPSIEEYSGGRLLFDWRKAARYIVREKITLLSFLMTPVVSAFLSYYIFSSQFIRLLFTNWIIRFFLGIIFFGLLSIVIFLIVYAFVYLFWKDIFSDIFKGKTA